MVIWFGAEEVLSDSMTLGGVILFTRFMTMLFTPVVSLGEQLNVLFRAMASGERIVQALDWDEQIMEPEFPVKLADRLLGQIEFKFKFLLQPRRACFKKCLILSFRWREARYSRSYWLWKEHLD